MTNGIDHGPELTFITDAQPPEIVPSPEGTGAAPHIEMSSGVSEHLGTTALQPTTESGGNFGALTETGPTNAAASETESDADLLQLSEPVQDRAGPELQQQGAAEGGNAQGQIATIDDRHGFLSLFADQIAAGDPAAADKVREFRDSSARDGQKGRTGVATSDCGKMEDLVGIPDPHSAIGGLFHDLGQLLPWGSMLETEYDRAVTAYLASRQELQ